MVFCFASPNKLVQFPRQQRYQTIHFIKIKCAGSVEYWLAQRKTEKDDQMQNKNQIFIKTHDNMNGKESQIPEIFVKWNLLSEELTQWWITFSNHRV